MTDDYRTDDHGQAFPDGILAEYERMRERYLCSDQEAQREVMRARWKQHAEESNKRQ